MGLAAARYLMADPEVRVIVGARRPEAARQVATLADPERVRILPLDLSSLESVYRFADSVAAMLGGAKLASLACNAGVQLVGARRMTSDGFEETFQANWLGHALLIDRLLPQLAPNAPVVMTASGTHDPANRTARLFGFRGGLFPDIAAVAIGELDSRASVRQLGLDRYATSKLVMILHVYALARARTSDGPRYLAFDPGLMPGTGLARDRSAFERWGWSTLLPRLAPLLSGTSTAEASAQSLARLLAANAHPSCSGAHVDYGLRITRSSEDSQRTDWQDQVASFARRIARSAMT
jgi:protochlorophyllide reductase